MDMSKLFWKVKRRDYSGIESWDTSNVVDMGVGVCFMKRNHLANH